jgi:hypothetical protein
VPLRRLQRLGSVAVADDVPGRRLSCTFERVHDHDIDVRRARQVVMFHRFTALPGRSELDSGPEGA